MQQRNGLGKRIASIREQLGERIGRRVTLEEFGRLVAEQEQREPGERPDGEVAYPRATASRWERGAQIPREPTLRAIADLGGVPFEELAAEVPVPRRRDLVEAQQRLGTDPPPVTQLLVRPRLPEVEPEAYTPALLTWLYRFLGELAAAGADRLSCNLAEFWLTRLIAARAAMPDLRWVNDEIVVLVWEGMAAAVRRTLWEEGMLIASHAPPAADEDPLAPLSRLGSTRELTYPERLRLAPVGALASPASFRALVAAHSY